MFRERARRLPGRWDVLLGFSIPRKTLRLAGREHGRAIPLAEMALWLFLHERLRNLAGVLNEKPRDRAERAVLEGNNSIRHASHGKRNGQHLDLGAFGGKSQC